MPVQSMKDRNSFYDEFRSKHEEFWLSFVLLCAVCLHVATASGPCKDLDVTGCERNPHLCNDQLLAEFTCPVTCNKCPTVPPSTPAATTADCSDLLKSGRSWPSGVYSMVTWQTHTEVDVFCDMETDGGGWTVLQHRVNGSVDFYQNFNSYENGFGSLHGEFWLGLRYLSEMTSRRNNTLRVDLQAPDGSRIYDVYEGFSVGPGSDYTLHLGKSIDSLHLHQNLLAYHSGHPFTTYDQLRGNHCAVVSHGGWWYYNCYTANLNGHYFVPGTSNNTAMEYSSLAYGISMKESKIMFR